MSVKTVIAGQGNRAVVEGQAPFSKTVASVSLDAVRGLAALIVCLQHWRTFMFVDYQDIQSHRSLYSPLYILTGAGHQAVIIFFVLSGYLVGGSVLRMLKKDDWSWRRYLTHRLVRLWLVLIPALCVGGVLDRVGLHSGAAPLMYAAEASKNMLGPVAPGLTAPTFAGNVFFLQTIFVPVFGSNSPLWSLANEFWYYLLFPLGVLALRGKTPTGIRVLSFVLFVAIAALAGKDILTLFPIWLLGALLASIQVPRVEPAKQLIVAAVYVGAFFFLAKYAGIPLTASDYLLGALTFGFLFVLLGAKTQAPSNRATSFSRRLASFSYSLYLFHFPFLLLVTAMTVHDTRVQPGPKTLAMGLVVLVGAVGYGWLAASLTEFRTERVRQWVESRVLSKPQAIAE